MGYFDPGREGSGGGELDSVWQSLAQAARSARQGKHFLSPWPLSVQQMILKVH